MAESTKLASLIRGIPKFDGNPIRYGEWKATTLAMLEISQNDMFEILTGEFPRSQEQYISAQTVRRADTMEAPVSSGETAEGGSTTAAASGHEAIVIDSTAKYRAGSTPALDLQVTVPRESTRSTVHIPSLRQLHDMWRVGGGQPGFWASGRNRNSLVESEITGGGIWSVLGLGLRRLHKRGVYDRGEGMVDGRRSWRSNADRRPRNLTRHGQPLRLSPRSPPEEGLFGQTFSDELFDSAQLIILY